ncbi:MAG: hypothetical protein QOE87_193 [Gaiellales bacterium]|jgi:hypothetical protein|nr:hypothetical protein [Gaiellales bacterium]
MTVAASSLDRLRVHRWTGAAGLLFLVLIIPAIVTESLGPEPTMSPAEVTAKFSSARTDVLISSVLLVAAVAAFFVFAVGVAETIRNARPAGLLPALSRSSGAVGVGILAVYTAIFASLASSIHHVQNVELVYGIFRAAYAIDSSSDLFLGLFMAASAVPIARSGLAGPWLTRFTLFGGTFYALGSLSITSPNSGIFGAFEILGALLFMLWVAVTSIRLLRTPSS